MPGTGAARLEEYNGRLIAAGGFGYAGSVGASNIAAWDGEQWSAFAEGTNGLVSTFIKYNGQLIAGGGFTSIDGAETQGLARWDGQHWQPYEAQMEGGVYILSKFRGDLIAGGLLTPGGLMRWDGSAWHALGDGVEGGGVGDVVTYQGELIAAGFFDTADGAPVNHIARWDGAGWQELGSGLTHFGQSWVQDLIVFGDELVAVGQISDAGGVPVQNAAAWNGTSWRALGELPLTGLSVAVVRGRLFAGGLGFSGYEVVYAWDGTNWGAVEGGPTIHAQTPLIPQISALAGYQGSLFAGGGFTDVAAGPSAYVARAVCDSTVQPFSGATPPRSMVRLNECGSLELLDESNRVLRTQPFGRGHGTSPALAPTARE